jgi:NAD(P)-dependent dehydrogenase (short-subunit alcohol dehydrogenase family)
VAGEKAIEQLKSEGLGNTAMIRIDVSREASVQEAYEELAGRIPRLDAGGPTGKYISDYGETPW